MSKENNKCEHDWAHIWLASRNYEVTVYCRHSLELKDNIKKQNERREE